MDRVAVVVGTRPEIIKMAEIVNLLGDRSYLVHTGQHWDHTMSGAFMEQLHLPAPDLHLAVGGGTRAQQIAQVMLGLENAFSDVLPSAVMVQGDTNSVVGTALLANAMRIPLVHVEAGLRSFDRNMPEEHNRVVTDHLADLCLAPTENNRSHLLDENIPADRIVVTGNTVIGAVQRAMANAPAEDLLGQLALTPGDYILATLHRPENTDSREALTTVFTALAEIAAGVGPILLPLHPRTERNLKQHGLLNLLEGLTVVAPLAYEEFIALASTSGLLISDSGGIQEEASVLGRPVIVVRRSTERPEGLGTFSYMSGGGDELVQLATALYGSRAEMYKRLTSIPSPYGDADAAKKSVEAVWQLLSG